ncbi:hypothetical protein IWW48_000836 [Coemansia sp. RSA 1200]|nr:hypothetical protein IWW48_000836 [Coemansia sp. RSA 1200]
MLTPSPFQTLPQHIAEKIAYYFSRAQRNVRYISVIDQQERSTIAWKLLCNISHRWRVLALGNLYREVTFGLWSQVRGGNAVFSRTPQTEEDKDGCPSVDISSFVKKVTVNIDDLFGRPDHRQTIVLDQIWPEDRVLPAARSLHIDVGYSPMSDVSEAAGPAGNVTYIDWIIRRIQSTLPGLQRIEIWLGLDMVFSLSPATLVSDELNATLFMATLFTILGWPVGKERSLADTRPLPNHSIIKQESILHLTRFMSNTPVLGGFLQEIIRRSASTLELLCIVDCSPYILAGLIFEGNGGTMVYPRLWQLEAICYFDEMVGRLREPIPEAPFPALRRLRLFPAYLFLDDTPFRGNSSTLVDLDIGLCTRSMGILQNHGVFSQNRYTNLCHVTVAFDSQSRGSSRDTDDFASFVFGTIVAKATRSLSINADISCQQLVRNIAIYPQATNIQILKLDRSRIRLLGMLAIVKQLPNMADATFGFGDIDEELTMSQNISIVDQLFPRYYPLSNQLKCWNVLFLPDAPRDSKVVAVWAIAFAVLCPRFTFAHVQRDAVERYTQGLEHLLNSGFYDKHADKIKQLLYV